MTISRSPASAERPDGQPRTVVLSNQQGLGILVRRQPSSTSRRGTLGHQRQTNQQAFHVKRGIKPGVPVGIPGTVLWVTYDISPSERVDGNAGYLRNALGLIRRLGNEYGFLLKLGARMDAIGPVCAPTAFDACAYERFRPWPLAGITRDADAGRTYDLDPANQTAGAVTESRKW